MAEPTFQSLPPVIEAGNQVIFTENPSLYPVTDWTLTLYIAQGGQIMLTLPAVVTGNYFTFTIPGAMTASFRGGQYDWAEYAQMGSVRETAQTGVVTVIPNLAINQPPTYAQQQVTNLQGALAKLNSGSNVSVNINGQSFTKRDLAQMNTMLTFWKAEVYKENAFQASLRGSCGDGRVRIRFVPSGGVYTYGPFPFQGGPRQ